MPAPRETRGRAAGAQRRDTSAGASSAAANHDGSGARGSRTRSRSSESWDAAEGTSSKRLAAAANGSSNKRDGGRSRHLTAVSAAVLTDASSSSSTAASHRHQSGDYGRGGIRSSSRMQAAGGSVDRRRSSSGSFNSNCSDEQEEEATCPLCLEALDETDRGLFPCECGYQVCLWCLHHIRDHLANKCPACRRDYDEKKFKYDQSRVVELTKQIGRKSRDKVCGSSDATRSGSSGGGSSNSRSACSAAARSGTASNSSAGTSSSSSSSTSSRGLLAAQQTAGAARRGSREAPTTAPAQAAALKDVRVIQRCLVYVIGIPPSIAKKEILRRHEFFGQYGKVLQIVVNKNQGHWGGPSFAVYVTYSTSKEAVAAIQGVDGAVYEGRTLKASFGTTKYCSHFLKGVRCQNPDCSYLHQLGSGKDSFTKEAMISAKHQFLDLTFPNTSERRQTASLFGKLPDSGARSSQGQVSEDPEEHLDCVENEGAGPGGESGESDVSSPAARPARGFGKENAIGAPATNASAVGGTPTSTAAAVSPSAVGGEGEEGLKSRGAKAKTKPQAAPCSTWASVAAGGTKPGASANAGAASASMPAATAPFGKSQHPVTSPPGLSTNHPMPPQHQQRQQEQLDGQQEAEASESDTERDTESHSEVVAANTNAKAADVGLENESQAKHLGSASSEPSAVCAGECEAPSKEEELAAEGAAAVPASAHDDGRVNQKQDQRHEQQEPPQQSPNWPCFHPTFPQRAPGTPVGASGHQANVLETLGASALSPGAPTGVAGARGLLPAQQQQPMAQHMEQEQRSVFAGMDVPSLSSAEQLMHQMQQPQLPQQDPLHPCAPDPMLQVTGEQMESGGRFGPPPGLEALGGPSSTRGCRSRSHSSSNNGFILAGTLFTEQGSAGIVGGVPYDVDSSVHTAAGSGSTSSSRFAFASNPDGDEEALFEIPGVEDCLLWLANPNTQSAGAVADEAGQHQGPFIRNAERPPPLDTNTAGESLPLPLANSWTQQRHSKDFVFGPGVGGASLPSLQHQRQPSDRWRQVCQHQHPATLVLQAKTMPGGAAAAASAFDRFDANSSRKGGWSGSERFGGHDQQHQLQQEQLQQLLRQQQQMLVQQQQPQARSRASAALPASPEQQQPQLLVQQQQQQQQQLALLQQLLPAAYALGRGGSAPPADAEEALKLLLSLIPNPVGQAQRMPAPQQQLQQLRYSDCCNPNFPLNTPGSRDPDNNTARMRAPRAGGGLPGNQLGATGASGSRGADESSEGCWGPTSAAAAAESGRGRSAARRGSVSSLEATDRGGTFPGCASYSHFDPHLSDSSQCAAGTNVRGGAHRGGLTSSGAMPPVCNAPPTHAGNELLPFLQQQRMQQIQQQQLQQLQRALESQRLE